jgi:hypothetical protein
MAATFGQVLRFQRISRVASLVVGVVIVNHLMVQLIVLQGQNGRIFMGPAIIYLHG